MTVLHWAGEQPWVIDVAAHGVPLFVHPGPAPDTRPPAPTLCGEYQLIYGSEGPVIEPTHSGRGAVLLRAKTGAIFAALPEPGVAAWA